MTFYEFVLTFANEHWWVTGWVAFWCCVGILHLITRIKEK